jgi:sigma-B regulation protein RsbU (phosphoserine phosphatase)
MQVTQDQIECILEVSRVLGATDDERIVLRHVADCLRDVLKAERATVFRYRPKENDLVAVVAHGTDGSLDEDPAPIQVPLGKGIAGSAGEQRIIINIPDAYADERFFRGVDEATGYKTRSMLTVPLVTPESDELIGVAQILNRADGPFTNADERLAMAVASQSAVAMRRAHLMEDRLRLARVERSLDLAREIQQDTFPKTFPSPSGWECLGWSMPADQTGGDTFDVAETSQGLHMLVGDATGHGIGPALSVAQVRSMHRMAARLNASPMDFIEHLNAQLHEDSRSSRFVTAWFGDVEPDSGRLRSIAMGQGPLFLIRADGTVDELEADAPPLGVTPDMLISEPTIIHMEPGDLFAVPTDGFMEALNEHGEEYGTARMVDLFREHRALPLDELLEVVREDTESFHQNIEPADDRTVLVVRRTSNGR